MIDTKTRPASHKSMGTGILLTALFGPLGLLYASAPSFFVGVCIGIGIAILTMGGAAKASETASCFGFILQLFPV
jgi:hypothetical protein